MTKQLWYDALVSGEFDRQIEQFVATRHCLAEFKLEEVLQSTDYASVLRRDEISVIASFLKPDRASIEDLDVIGGNQPTLDGLRSALYVDDVFHKRFGDVSNYAYYGFRNETVTEDLWKAFLLSAASTNPLDFMDVFFAMHHSPKIFEELFSEEVLEAILASKNAKMNLLGSAAAQTLYTSYDCVSKVKAFVTPEFFTKLAIGRQFYGLMPVQQCIHSCYDKHSPVPTAYFLRSLLPDDIRTANQLDLRVVPGNNGMGPLSFINFVSWLFQESDLSRYNQAMYAAIGLIQTLEYEAATSEWQP